MTLNIYIFNEVNDMTNAEKFIEVMNKTFDAGLTIDNLNVFQKHAVNAIQDQMPCSPCGWYKKGACKGYTCAGCRKWWDKEYVAPNTNKKIYMDINDCGITISAHSETPVEEHKKWVSMWGIYKIPEGTRLLRCPLCGEHIPAVGFPEEHNFCPKCGSALSRPDWETF